MIDHDDHVGSLTYMTKILSRETGVEHELTYCVDAEQYEITSKHKVRPWKSPKLRAEILFMWMRGCMNGFGYGKETLGDKVRQVIDGKEKT